MRLWFWFVFEKNASELQVLGTQLFTKNLEWAVTTDLPNRSIQATMEACLQPDTDGCRSAQGCPAGKSGMTSHAFNPDCYISFLVQVQYDT